eukprot:gene20048-22015_t
MKNVRPYVSKRLRQSQEGSIAGVGEERGRDNSSSKENKIIDAIHEEECVSASSSSPQTIPHSASEATKSAEPKCQASIQPAKNFLPKTCITKTRNHKNAVNCIRWSASASNCLLLSASMDSTVGIWSCSRDNAKLVKELKVHCSAVKDARWGKTGSDILSCGYDKTARITDVELGKEMSCYKHKDFVTALLYHPEDSNVFLTGTGSNGLFAWDIRAEKYVRQYKAFFGQIQDILFHPDGKIFFSAAEVLKRNSLDKAIIAWDFETAAVVSNQISQEAFGCTCLQSHPYADVFLAQYGTGYISIFSNSPPYKLNKYKRFEGHQTAGFRVGFTISPDGNYVISGDRMGGIHAYDYKTSRCLMTFSDAYSSACMDVAFHPFLPSVMASCSWDGEVSFWR